MVMATIMADNMAQAAEMVTEAQTPAFAESVAGIEQWRRAVPLRLFGAAFAPAVVFLMAYQ